MSEYTYCEMTYISLFSVNYAVSVKVSLLTANVDLQLTEVRRVVGRVRKLHDEVSVRRHVRGTGQVDCGRGCYRARVLTADGVVPERYRCPDGG